MRAILWAPLFVCGLAFVLIFAGRRERKWRRRGSGSAQYRSGAGRENRTRAARQRLIRLRDAVIGNGRDVIEQLLGPPPAIAGPDESPVWYYPLDPVHRRVIAIEFDGTVARNAQFIDAPRRS